MIIRSYCFFCDYDDSHVFLKEFIVLKFDIKSGKINEFGLVKENTKY